MNFKDIKNQIKDVWDYDEEFIWTSDLYKYFSCSNDSHNMKTEGEYFLEFYNDSNDNFFRIYDSKGDIVGFIEGKELKKFQIENNFINFIFNNGNFMFSTFNPR